MVGSFSGWKPAEGPGFVYLKACASLDTHSVDNLAFLTSVWMRALGLLPASGLTASECTVLQHVCEMWRPPRAGSPHQLNSPHEAKFTSDWGILIKAPRTMKKNTVSLSRSSCLGLRFAKVLPLWCPKKSRPPTLSSEAWVRPFCRYVSRVLVHDLAMDRKWYFLCNSWLSIDVGDCVLDKVFPVATEQDRKQFRYFCFPFKQMLFYFGLSSLGKLHHNNNLQPNKSTFDLAGLGSFKCDINDQSVFLVGNEGPWSDMDPPRHNYLQDGEMFGTVIHISLLMSQNSIFYMSEQAELSSGSLSGHWGCFCMSFTPHASFSMCFLLLYSHPCTSVSKHRKADRNVHTCAPAHTHNTIDCCLFYIF